MEQADLIARYLQAVAFWLPAKQKTDIAAELSADIHAQIEEREGSAGRTLTQAEVEELLKQRGVMGYLWNVPTPQPTPGAITLEGMADAFAEVQRYDLAPTFMFVNPRVYKEWNPAGYAELVRLQNETSNPT